MLFRAILSLALLLPCAAFAQDDCPAARLVKITMQASAFPSLPGQTVKISVFVEPVVSVADPTGTVQLSEGLTDLGTFTLMSAQFSLTRTFNESGAHVLNATYSGDFNYCSTIASYGHQVDHLTPSVTLASSAASAAFGSPVTLTAQLSPQAPAGVAAPLGPVQFLEGTTVLGSVVPAAGKASLTLANLAPGAHQIVAVLIGDAVWYQVRSATVTQTINRAATNTVLTAIVGVQDTKLTATVTTDPPGTAVPDGSVQFVDAFRNVTLGTAALPAGAASASVTVPASQILASVGHALTAVYSGSANFASSTSIGTGIPVAVNAAGVISPNAAPDEIVSLYGSSLADSTQQASTVPLPVSLNGYKVTVTDSAGTDRPAGLYLISPGQINFVMPAATAPGTAIISVGSPASRQPVIPIRVNVGPVAPGFFTTTSDGKGTPAAQLIRVRADGSQVTETVTAAGIRIGGDAVYLVLYGTGIRNRSSLAATSCLVGGQTAVVSYAGAQTESPGLDQVNILLPASLAGKGPVSLTVTVDGQVSNAVTLNLIG